MSDRLTINPGLRYTLNFPSTEINGQTAVFNLQTQQLEYPGDQSGAAAEEGQLRSAPGRRLSAHRQDDRSAPATAWSGSRWRASRRRSRRRRSRSCRRCRSARSTRSRRRSCCRTGRRVAPIAPTPTAGLGQGVFAVDGTLGSGYVAAVERLGAARADARTRPSRSAYVGSNITHVGIPDTNLNQLTGEPAGAGQPLLNNASPNPVLRHHPALVVARRSDDSAGAAAEAVSGIHDGQPLSQQRRHDALPGTRAEPAPAARRAGCRTRSPTRAPSWSTMPRRCSTRRS